MRLRYCKFLNILVLAISLISCQEKEQEVTIGYLPIIAHLPAMVAEDQGFFEGVQVKFKVYGSSNDLLNDLSKGEIDCATTIAFTPIAKYFSILYKEGKSFPIKIFSYSKTSKENPFDGVFTRNDSEISSLADLEGKSVGVFPGTTAKNILTHLLERDYKINTSTIKWVYLPPSTQIEALRTGDIDALFTYETVRTIAENSNLKIIHGSVIADVLENAPYGCSAINTEFYKDNRKLALTIIHGLDKSIGYIKNNPESSRAILKENLSLSNEITNKCNLEYRVSSDEINHPDNIKLISEFIKILEDSKELENDFPINESLIEQ